MIARFWQRSEIAPGILGGIVNFVRSDSDRIHTSSADRVDLSIECRKAYRSARILHRCERPPAILRRIVFERDVQSTHVNIPREAANRIDFAVHSNGTRM